MSDEDTNESGSGKKETPKKEIPKKRVQRKKAKIVKRKKGGGAEFSEEAVPVWMSSGMVGVAITAASMYAQSQGVGEAINEDTITTGMLQVIEVIGLVMAGIGRFKAKNKLTLKLWK